MATEQERKKVYTYLQTQSIMIMATASKNGEPHASTLLFAVDDSLNFYFITRPDSKKGQLLEQNPLVSVVIGDEAPMSVQASGTVERINEKGSEEKALDMIIESAGKKADFWPPIFHIKKGDSDFAIYKIETKQLKSIDLTLDKISTNKELFTQIIG